jgi:hypothetical protein
MVLHEMPPAFFTIASNIFHKLHPSLMASTSSHLSLHVLNKSVYLTNISAFFSDALLVQLNIVT